MTTAVEVPSPSTVSPNLTIEQQIVKDYQEESGFTFGDKPTIEQKMLAQKYGIVAPQFTREEKTLIAREERSLNA